MTDELVAVARHVLETFAARGWTLAIAETDTGGLILSSLTAVPGSSRVVVGGVVPYDDRLKLRMLDLDSVLLAHHGAVSGEVAVEMAKAVRRLAQVDVGLATTGIAGPGGGTAVKPVGLAYVAAATAQQAQVREFRWRGDRATNRESNARAALRLALELTHKE